MSELNIKHTPGPWFLSPDRPESTDENDERSITDDQEGHGCVIARVWPLGLDFDEDGTGSRDANARLIAAAPDLLAACIRAKGFVESWGKKLGDWDIVDQNTINAINAAIEKATGVIGGAQ